MKLEIVVFSVILMGSQCSGQLRWWSNLFQNTRRTSAKPAAQVMTTTTTTAAPTKPKPTSGGFFSGLFGSSSSSSSGSSSSSSSRPGGFFFGSSSGVGPFGGAIQNFFSTIFEHDICPMIQGLPTTMDVQAFKRQCYYTGSRCGRCNRGELCCASNVEGSCQMACAKGVSEKRKPGNCPSGMTRKPTGGIAWMHTFCKWAKATQAITTPNACRVDGDCEGAEKCCQSLPTPKDIFGACERKCVAPAGISDGDAAAGATNDDDDDAAKTTPTPMNENSNSA